MILMELLSLVLTLRPAAAPPAERPLPVWWARAAHALLLRVVRQYDPSLAEQLHEGSETRPFTASSLLGSFPQGSLDPAGDYSLRFTSLQPALTDILLNSLQPAAPLAVNSLVELDDLPFQVTAAHTTPTGHPWARTASYAELAGAWLVNPQPPPRHITLQFTSPTAFHSQERQQPLPLPELLFNSLLERWNAFATLSFPAETRRFAAECLALSRFKLESRSVPLKRGALRIGAVGLASYIALKQDRYWLGVLHTLAEFALFSGVGQGVSAGMGQCRKTQLG